MKTKISFVLLFLFIGSLTMELPAAAIFDATEDFNKALQCCKHKKRKRKIKKCQKQLLASLNKLLDSNKVLMNKLRPDEDVILLEKKYMANSRLLLKIEHSEKYLDDDLGSEKEELISDMTMLKEMIFFDYKTKGMKKWEKYKLNPKKGTAQSANLFFQKALRYKEDNALDSLAKVSKEMGTYKYYIEAEPAKNSNLSAKDVDNMCRGIEHYKDDFHKYYFEKNRKNADCEIYLEIHEWTVKSSSSERFHDYSTSIKTGTRTETTRECVTEHVTTTKTVYEKKKKADGTVVEEPKFVTETKPVQKWIRVDVEVPVYETVTGRIITTDFKQEAHIQATAKVNSKNSNCEFRNSKFSTIEVNRGVEIKTDGDRRALPQNAMKKSGQIKTISRMKKDVSDQFLKALKTRYYN